MIRAFWARHYERGRCSFIFLAIMLLVLAKFTWLKYGDLIIDTGRELYVPAKLAGGALLYKDIFYLYGPFSPYFNALLFKIFGVHISSLLVGGIITAALTTLAIYRLSRQFLKVAASTITALTFLVLLAFGHYTYLGNYNFILPYSYPATHAILFALASFFFFFRFLRDQQRKPLILAGASLCLCLLTRIEIGIMLGAALSGAILLNTSSRSRAALLVQCVFLPLAVAGAVYAGFAIASAGKLNDSNIWDLLKSNTATSSPFAAWLAGTDAPLANLRLMMNAAFFYCFLIAWASAGAWGLRKIPTLALTPLARAGGCAMIMLLAAGIFFFLEHVFTFEHQYRPLPIIYLLTIFLARDLKLAVLSFFSLLLASRMLLDMHPWHYGFYILVPGLIVYHAFFFRIIPDRIKVPKPAMHGAFFLMLSIFLTHYLLVSRSYYAGRTLPVISDRGTLNMIDSEIGRSSRLLVTFLKENTADKATVVVLPEGLTINFLTGRDNPLYYYSYLPQDLARDSINDAVIRELKEKKVDYIVLVNRPLEEYGKHAFGQDYAQKIWGYVSDHYAPYAGIGPMPYTSEARGQFSARIYQRKE